MKSRKKITNTNDLQITPMEVHEWEGRYLDNFKERGIESMEGYVQATIDFLRTRGYTVIEEDEDAKF